MNDILQIELSISLWILFIILICIATWYYKRSNLMSILNKNGIPGNKPHLIFGNLLQKKRLTIFERQEKLIEKYGKIVGYYTGAKPIILVADPELANKILITDFINFKNRSSFFDYLDFNQKAGSILKYKDQRWKLIRGLLTPAFSAHKLKAMTPIIEESVDTFLDNICKNSNIGKEFNIFEKYKSLFIEMILKTSFGIEIDSQNINSKLFKNIEQMIEIKFNKIVLLIISCFPELANLVNYIRAKRDLITLWLGSTPFAFVWNTFSRIIELRKDNQDNHYIDILQSMLDSKITNEGFSDIMIEKLEEIDNENSEYTDQNDIRKETIGNSINLSEDEIIINCIVFLGAGYDTTSSALAYVTHFLINYPEIQDKVRQEVIGLYKKDGKLGYNTLNDLEYMECVINESLRLYPPVFNGSTRECSADYKYKNITIPKGATVVLCTHYMHNDPEHWSEPEKFDPMRFSPERRHEIVSGTYQPFGLGPRKCIAIRLGYFILKLTLAKLLFKFRFEAGPNSEIGKLSTKFKLLSIVPKNGIFVKFSPI